MFKKITYSCKKDKCYPLTKIWTINNKLATLIVIQKFYYLQKNSKRTLILNCLCTNCINNVLQLLIFIDVIRDVCREVYDVIVKTLSAGLIEGKTVKLLFINIELGLNANVISS